MHRKDVLHNVMTVLGSIIAAALLFLSFVAGFEAFETYHQLKMAAPKEAGGWKSYGFFDIVQQYRLDSDGGVEYRYVFIEHFDKVQLDKAFPTMIEACKYAFAVKMDIDSNSRENCRWVFDEEKEKKADK